MCEVDLAKLKFEAKQCLAQLYKFPDSGDIEKAKHIISQLKSACEYEVMGELLEAVTRLDLKDATMRRVYAQQLIEMGNASVAIDVLKATRRGLDKQDPEYAEVGGLLGRAYKQIFFDAGDKTSKQARLALSNAIKSYRKIYEDNPEKNSWHGVNLVALLMRARRMGLRTSSDLNPKSLANTLLGALLKAPEDSKDEWYAATLAEVALANEDWSTVEQKISEYLADERVTAFQLNSLLRQLTEVWELEDRDERARSLVDILRARIAELDGGELAVSAQDIQRLRARPDPSAGQLEAILGSEGHKTYRWWQQGLECARSVAAIYQKLAGRVGTGFLVDARAFGLNPEKELLLLTNFHVVNPDGANPGLRPSDVEVAFETESVDKRYAVSEIVWSSPIEKHDACLLKLEAIPPEIEALKIARALPALEANAKVYVIGHPRGRELSFSFQDNQLLDHEGPPQGAPQIPEVCRLHYRAPTEPGSSGSPVFNANLWEVVALHHSGGKFGMSKLNGKSGTYSANEGIGIVSIISKIKSC